ncbi:hypothetical protein SAMN05443244_3393 [Terriglobus roseus]|uniref:Uncharacterized protein n=1 Tax=Terriglobus roseus TaxID=392734 RepID=A0A1H4SAL8_9BACT|nr:hypothetical protein SAMN05443244_3393 [Terriglobus roseus]
MLLLRGRRTEGTGLDAEWLQHRPGRRRRMERSRRHGIASDQQRKVGLRKGRCCCIGGECRLLRCGRKATLLQDAGAMCAMRHAACVLHRRSSVCRYMVARWHGFHRVFLRGRGRCLRRRTVAAGHRPCRKHGAAQQKGEQHREMDQAPQESLLKDAPERGWVQPCAGARQKSGAYRAATCSEPGARMQQRRARPMPGPRRCDRLRKRRLGLPQS